MVYKITSGFLQQESFRKYPHNGIDLKMETGEKLRAITDGKILVHDYGSVNAGKTVLIQGEDGRTYIYGHLSEFSVREGQIISKGELIGLSGNSGHSTGAHLHFGVKEGGKFVDPSPHVQFIQNMNDPHYLVNLPNKTEILNQTYSMFEIFKDTSSSYSDLFQNLKLNLIYLIHSIDYTMFIHCFHNLSQFFS